MEEGTVACIFLLLFSLELFLAASPPFSDVGALLAFQKGITHDPQACLANTWHPNSLDSSGCPLTWCGVSCFNGMVTALNLTHLSLGGTINLGTLAKMPMLSSLDFSYNSFSGTISNDLANLGSLQFMDLSHNLFSGHIPESFSKLRKLYHLNLSFNHLNGTMPVGLSEMNLTVLDLHHNQLYGTLDPLLMSFPALLYVDLSVNNFSGPLPLQPTTPPPLLSIVQHVNLSYNQLSGPLVQDKVSVIFAQDLQVLDVSNNLLFGPLPPFEYLYALQTLRLGDNLFSGTVPSSLFTTMKSLEVLDLSKNNLTGEIPMVMSPILRYLNLSSNLLYGLLPEKIRSCKVLDLSNNKFTGDLSEMIRWDNSLEVLDLSHNSITGVLPDVTSHFILLGYLNLSHNELFGSIPENFGLLPKARILDLSFNILNGSIPPAMLNSSTLSYLSLSHNRLSGGIPLQPSISYVSEKDVPLAVAGFPSQFGQLSHMETLDLSNNKLNGSIPDAINILQSLVVLDLSSNLLAGNIPYALCNLSFLQNLYLSDNQLTGTIPNALPESIKNLKLSNNNLSGTIPSNLNRFSSSSFFPGNNALKPNGRFPWFNASTPKSEISSGQSHHQHIGTAVILGLIGGCILVVGLVVAGCFFLYQKKLCIYQDGGKDSEASTLNKELEKSHKLWSPYAAYSSEHSAPPAVGFSEDLLAAGKGSYSDKVQGLTNESSDPWKEDFEASNLSKILGLAMSPSRTRHRSSSASNNQTDTSPQAEELFANESPPVSMKIESPDRLAGDLYFVDNTIMFSADELSRAPAEVLGRSSHGTSYKATLDNGHVLAVKWLKEGLAKGKKDFAREVKKLGKIRHPNVNPLRAYYWGPREHEKLIISDYASSGSLSAHLSGQMGKRLPLSWQQRLMISVDIARGLLYLHTEHHTPHGNLKATNVLLDNLNLSGRLADYGLHLLMTPEGVSNQILNAGGLGYRAPELAIMRNPKPSFKADVYSFGVIILEILTGKGAGNIISGHCEAVNLTDWVKLLVMEGRTIDCFDPILVGAERRQEPPRGIDDMLSLALKCISPQSERPNIRSVYQELTSITIGN